ncbi:acylpyruvate hydrolase [Natronobacillus azotifigens]|uniref:Fumarylacetoacetate hydrolase family protein n=1 Tax=Natronobacillus azotifigens TaxID=472978 RepID=A0A9J6RA83_9BACI|nr:fumarylacetoacetate hydrolase family protein [Natronobacillus azotifigens]MCZ0702447.1 fumarylacetoacetate hydrolase family protein [Natronobacillus azotifigens]
MKFITYQTKQTLDGYRTGLYYQDRVFDLQTNYHAMLVAKGESDLAYTSETLCPSNPTMFYQLGKVGFDRAKKVSAYVEKTDNLPSYSGDQVKLGPPVTNPSKIICVGTNYRDHVVEMKSELPTHPVLFAKYANALIGPEDNIEKPSVTKQLDYEVELAVVIGKKAKNVREANALDYVAGYTIANDISARDLQKRTVQWLQGKTLDRSTPVGPWLVTTDEIADPGKLGISSKVNGEQRQSSNTDQLIFSVPNLIAFISELMTLEPGDIILTGTPDGVGFAQEPPKFLRSGDEVVLEIEGIGSLKNIVHDC